MSEAIYRKIALLTDDEAESCINGLLKGLTIENPDYARLLQSPSDMKKVIAAAATETGVSVAEVKDIEPQQGPKAVRHILLELADDQKFGLKVEAWIDGARPSLIEPVTTALVLAGIILALSANIDVGYKKKDGFWFNIKKKPTSDSLLKKFFGLFR
jgi:hypothetical protein